jgi:hypothetical protein
MSGNATPQVNERVDESIVAHMLACIANPPNRRTRPASGDVEGLFDFWFDGGAAQIQTGHVVYEFVGGARASVGVPLFVLSIDIELADGRRVRIQQQSDALPTKP